MKNLSLSKTFPIFPVYSFNLKKHTKRRPVPKRIDPATLLPYQEAKAKAKDPKEMAKPANIPPKKLFINLFIIHLPF